MMRLLTELSIGSIILGIVIGSMHFWYKHKLKGLENLTRALSSELCKFTNKPDLVSGEFFLYNGELK